MQPENEKAWPPLDTETPRRTLGGHVKGWAKLVGLVMAFLIFISTCLFQLIRVDGVSMSDTLLDGEIILVTRPEYLLGQPALGDIIICRYPGRTGSFVKRLMGGPGDVIEVRNNIVYRNGASLSEPYLTPERNNDDFCMVAFTLAKDEYFVMGDNRNNSHDSRNYYGYDQPVALRRSQIIGHVRCVVYPWRSLRSLQ